MHSLVLRDQKRVATSAQAKRGPLLAKLQKTREGFVVSAVVLRLDDSPVTPQMSKMPRVPDRESKKAPKTAQYREKIGRHLEVIDKSEKKRQETAEVRSKTSAARSYRALALLVIGVAAVLVALLVVVRVLSTQ